MLLREHEGALTADFQRYYGLDLADLRRGRLGVKRAAQLCANLPSGAQVWHVVNADQAWTPTDYLLAACADLLQQVAYLNSDGKGSKPKPIDRPAQARENAERERAAYEKARYMLAKRGITI